MFSPKIVECRAQRARDRLFVIELNICRNLKYRRANDIAFKRPTAEYEAFPHEQE